MTLDTGVGESEAGMNGSDRAVGERFEERVGRAR